MSDLNAILCDVLAGRFTANLVRIRELATPLTEKQFWTKPFPYGNSFGHLVLHLTGNLNYYIGAQIANSGYTRDREREFTDATPPSKEETSKRLDAAVAMVMETIRAQSPTDWAKAYSAVGTECKTRLDIVIECVAHMQHHIGQMIYIANEWQRRAQP
ncbi:MAG TPA: DinB family protein [Candidatus Binatia bacterium]|nr:DinB family protein [Candidatus Binatia bacterium]